MKSRLLQTVLALCALVVSVPVFATAQRTFVASDGSDASPCSRAQPCRSFAAAIPQTISGGEVIVLDSAGYGPVTITIDVSIIAPAGIYAGISARFGTGIVVDTGVGDVTLSGITIVGAGLTGSGIDFKSARTLRLERMSVSGFWIGLQAMLGTSTSLIIRDSAFEFNQMGMLAGTDAGILTIDIDNTHFDGNRHSGANFWSNVVGTVSASSASGNFVGGVGVQPTQSGATANMTFRNCVFSRNQVGFVAGGYVATVTTVQLTSSEFSDNSVTGVIGSVGSTVNMSDSSVTRNNTGISPSAGGSIRSFGDNRLYGNTTDGAFTSTIGKS